MKRPWTRGEKSLFLAPLLFLALAGGTWVWNASRPVTIKVEAASGAVSLKFSPDGKRLAGFFFASDGGSNFGRVFDVENGSRVCDLEEPPPLSPNSAPYRKRLPYYSPYDPSWSPDGQQIVAGYNDDLRGTTKVPMQPIDKYKYRDSPNFISKIAIWDAQSGAITGNHYYAPINEDSSSKTVHFSEDGKKLIGGGKPPAIFDADTGKRLQVWSGKLKYPYRIKANRQLGLVAELALDTKNRLQVVDTRTKQTVWELKAGTSFGPFEWQGDILGVIDFKADKRDRLILWNGKSRKLLASPPIPKTGVSYDFRFNPVNQTLVYSSLDSPEAPTQCELVVWDYARHRVLWRQSVPARVPGLSTQWSPDGKWLSLSIYTAAKNSRHILLFDHTGKLRLKRYVASSTHAWSPDSKKLALTIKQNQGVGIQIISVPE